MKEIWKDIPGYEGIYQVSNTGKVRSLTRKVHNYMKPGRELTPHDNGRHYQYVSLYGNGKKQKHAYIHILVATAFLGSSDGRTQVNHKDFNKKNNCVDNLEWVTREQNIRHFRESAYCKAVEENRTTKIYGKFVERVLREKDNIIANYNSGLSIKETAKATGTGRDFVRNVLLLFGYLAQ